MEFLHTLMIDSEVDSIKWRLTFPRFLFPFFLLLVKEVFAGDLSFNYLTVNNGLSQNSITSIIQDSKGLIWIGSYDGLNRFDGFSTVVKRHDPENENSLTENRILCMTKALDDEIWIGTEGGGINVYKPDNDKFFHYSRDQGHLPHNDILTICSDSLGNIWIGTEAGLTLAIKGKNNVFRFVHHDLPGGVLKLCPNREGNMWILSNPGIFLVTQQSSQVKNEIEILSPDGFQRTYAQSIFCDSSNQLWISAAQSLYRVNRTKEGSLQVENLYLKAFSQTDVSIRSIVEDLEGNLWLGTEMHGLFKLTHDKRNDSLSIHSYNTTIPFCNISDNSIRTLHVDKTNTLWIGFHQKGVNYADLSYKKFNLLTDLCDPVMTDLGYKSKYISITYCDSNDRVWIISENDGLYVYDRKYKRTSSVNNSPFSQNIASILESRCGDFWMGANERLLTIKRTESENERYLLINSFHRAGIGVIRTLCEDLYGRLWFGSITGEGLYLYDPSTGQLNIYGKEEGISTGRIFYISRDEQAQVIWVGTLDKGLIRIEYGKEREIKANTYTTATSFRLTSNHIWHIYGDKSNHLWIGTDAGLNKVTLNEKREITSVVSVSHPLLAGIKIMAITEDLHHQFWLNCSQGLYCYDPEKGIVKIYTHEDGLQSNTFTEAASISSDGCVFTGGINGLNYFFPEQIQDNPHKSQVAFVDFRIYGKSIRPGEESEGQIILKEDINTVKEIVLNHRNNNFMFEFVGIHFAIPEKNLFQFKLEGFDDNWILANSKLRVASYSNLPAGDYLFKIISSNNDGVWSDQEKQIRITILPPPWKTAWAYCLYVLAISGLVYFAIHYLLTKQRLNHDLQIERLEKEKMNEVNEMKMSFFTNITHEFRTPLALILSPLKDLLSDKKQNRNVRLRLQIINRNTLRLLNLINQTLDIRKLSSGNMPLLITPNNLRTQIENMIESFGFHVRDRLIQVKFKNELAHEIQWYDKHKIDKVLLNILSNAFKFTPKNGSVTVRVWQEHKNEVRYVVISVKDSGKGITSTELSKIFEPFYQAQSENMGGSGIGLSYVKSLLDIHQGEISVDSKEGEGACFTFRFPANRDAYDEALINEIINVDDFYLPVIPCEEADSESNIDDNGFVMDEDPPAGKDEKIKKILIVEDNIDLRMYIKDCLIKHYHVLESSNGATGLQLAKKELPDLIITDVMMPVMDGIDLCRNLKLDARTCHIPVFMHSIKSDENTMKQAMDAGAEDFIGKPFNYSMLRKKINNFFKTRELLITRIQAGKILELDKIEIPSSDDEFLRRIMALVEDNLSNPDFNVASLSGEIGLSRIQLHRKIMAITGKQTSDLIRDVRLQRAEQLLKSGEKRVSEVMWETGFNNHSRFKTYFREKYGMSPREYMESNQKRD